MYCFVPWQDCLAPVLRSPSTGLDQGGIYFHAYTHAHVFPFYQCVIPVLAILLIKDVDNSIPQRFVLYMTACIALNVVIYDRQNTITAIGHSMTSHNLFWISIPFLSPPPPPPSPPPPLPPMHVQIQEKYHDDILLSPNTQKSLVPSNYPAINLVCYQNQNQNQWPRAMEIGRANQGQSCQPSMESSSYRNTSRILSYAD